MESLSRMNFHNNKNEKTTTIIIRLPLAVYFNVHCTER